ncbi:protein BUNDLE SHEATH DEFECTIVE 2, chloroplastic [Impatiens glandulifera]|uniref:protein BUNDLE SHEATH DEFECTIVE 2, chloroplastic n=1 Tax=Impatiens glandulifera TaxID=253017 RepID=UPI001FB18680|nr:protein BUNDLE SHEATH DEFECTIVE 2, chloroplastic [Impatiens glandulifera]
MAVNLRTQSLFTMTIRADSSSYSSNDVPPSRRNSNLPPLHLLSVPKPSWIVRTESNVRMEQRKKPDPSCVICLGSGRIDCYHCRGRGRTNCVQQEMLPMGEWPKWCRECRGSGLGYCSRCLGTGEYRYIMGFQFMNREFHDNRQPTRVDDDGGSS